MKKESLIITLFFLLAFCLWPLPGAAAVYKVLLAAMGLAGWIVLQQTKDAEN